MPKRKGGSEDIDDIESALLSLTQKPDTSKTTPNKKRKLRDDDSPDYQEESSDEDISDQEVEDISEEEEEDFDEEEFEITQKLTEIFSARLPEGSVQRETMIFKRQEAEKRRKERKEAKDRLKRNRGIENNKKNLRSSKRTPRKEPSKDSAIKEITSRRAKKDISDDDSKKKSDKADSESSAPSSTYSSSINQNDISRNASLVTEPEVFKLTLETLRPLQLKRRELEEFYVKGIFAEKLPGFFVRVFFETRETKPVYRIYEILEVKEGNKIYKIENNITTNKVLLLRYGKNEREFRMEYVSNQDFDESEYQRWLLNMDEAKLFLPDEAIIERKLRHKEKLQNYKLKSEDFERIVQENEKRREKPVNVSTEMNNLIHKREAAKEVGNRELYESLNERISELEDLLEQKKMKISNSSKGINSINSRNRQVNIALNSIYGSKKQEEEDEENDPFSRRKTESTLIFNPEDEGRDRATAKKAKKEVVDSFKNFNIWEEFDFEIDIDLDKYVSYYGIDKYSNEEIDQFAPPTVKPVYYVPDPNLSYTTSKIPSRKISFSEYKQRKGR